MEPRDAGESETTPARIIYRLCILFFSRIKVEVSAKAVSIKDVCHVFIKSLSDIDEETLLNAEEALASWIGLIDILDGLTIENNRIKAIVEDTKSELFKDINISIVMSASENYSAACILARGCIEKCVYILYFIDHPMIAFRWSMNNEDLSFSAITEEMSSPNYFEAATGNNILGPNKPSTLIAELRKLYRRYSESVHGKYRYTETHKGKAEVGKEYYSTIKQSANTLKAIVKIRRGE